MDFNTSEKGALDFPRIVLIALMVVSVACISVYTREGNDGILHRIQSSVHSIVAPIGFLSANAGAAIDDAGAALSDAGTNEETLSALRQRVAELTEMVTQGEEYRLESERLQGLLNLKETYKIEGVSGRVIGRNTDSWNQTITIDVGSAEGVEVGLTVMGPSGVIGQVVSVGSGSSEVRLLSDPKSGAAAIVQSSRADGIVRGSLSGVLHLENISADVEVKQGDVVLTSGLGGSYTKGLLIGTVVRVEGNAKDGTRTIVVAPNEQAAVLEEVMVVFSASESVTIVPLSTTSGSSGLSGSSDSSNPSGEAADQVQSASARLDDNEEGSNDAASDGDR